MAMYPDSNASRMSSQTMQQQANPPSGTTPAAIVTRDLVRLFGQKAAVNHLNLTVSRGEFFGFLGPNGAGKSTTIKMMVGLLRPTSGSVWVGGVDVWKEPVQARAATPEEVLAAARFTPARVIIEIDPARALDAARHASSPDDVILAAGSLFLVGALKQALAHES